MLRQVLKVVIPFGTGIKIQKRNDGFFEENTLLNDPRGTLWGSFLDPLGVHFGPFGAPLGPFGALWDPLGYLFGPS